MRTRWTAALLLVGTIACGKKEPAYAGPWVVEEEGGASLGAADGSGSARSSDTGASLIAEATVASAGPIDAALSAAGPSADAGRAPINDARVDVDFGPCFGTCPVYALHLKSDGTLSGEGAPRKLSDEQTQGILRLFDDAFAKPITRCPTPTDVQHVKVTYKRGTTVRSTEYWSGQPCPSKVVDAVKRLDALRGH